MSSTTVVKCDINLKQISEIKKYIDKPHGASLVALTAVDKANSGMTMEIDFPSSGAMDIFVQHLFEIWHKYKPIPSRVRSVKKNGKFLSDLYGMELEEKDPIPASEKTYGQSKFFIDIDVKMNEWKIRLIKWGEHRHRYVICRSPKQTNAFGNIFGLGK